MRDLRQSLSSGQAQTTERAKVKIKDGTTYAIIDSLEDLLVTPQGVVGHPVDGEPCLVFYDEDQRPWLLCEGQAGPSTGTGTITMDTWHVVGAAGEPAFGAMAAVDLGDITWDGDDPQATPAFRKFPDGTVHLRG